MLRHFELFLACRYLKKKRLAFFSIAAVALSVAMLIVVSSVTGGYVKQYRLAFHRFHGDIIIRADSLMGFPYYDELIAETRKLDEVREATPVIKQFGLLRIDQPNFKLFVKVIPSILGIEPESYSRITKFKESLHKQSGREGPPSFQLPEKFANDPRIKGACIVGVEVPYNRRPDGSYDRKEELYDSEVILSMMALRRTGLIDREATVRYALLLIDDSETSMPLVDDQIVYIPFELAQKMSRMAGYRDDAGHSEPPRASQIQILAEPDADLQELKKRLREIWDKIAWDNSYVGGPMVFETWDEQEGISILINQLEHDRTLMTVLFGIMGVVSIFLIFCIFFVIVTEKIPDIGIIKSVGGSRAGVGRIFFFYAGAVGVVGSLLGLAMGWPFVIHINAIHDWIGRTFGWKIYDPRVLLFPDIPNELDFSATVIIMIAALVGSLIGSMIPADRAALMKPIQALRYE